MTGEQNLELATRQMNTRFDYIDVAKALGMLFIIWGHVASGQNHQDVKDVDPGKVQKFQHLRRVLVQVQIQR